MIGCWAGIGIVALTIAGLSWLWKQHPETYPGGGATLGRLLGLPLLALGLLSAWLVSRLLRWLLGKTTRFKD